MLTLDYEQKYWSQGYTHILGIDEVGRGCLAGPVVVAGVMFDKNHSPIEGVRDSKKISPKNREELFADILNNVHYYSIELGTVAEIDSKNILQTTLNVMKKVVLSCPKSQVVLVDGNKAPPGLNQKIETIVQGDDRVYSIAAASILAKVFRDRLMKKLHTTYPAYDWNHNVGYGTKKHREALLSFGPTKHHREKFVKNILANINPLIKTY